jgi:hypothetical protein
MSVSIFDDKLKEPSSLELYKALRKTSTLLRNIEKHLLDQYGELTHEWKYYSKKAGWTLALVHKGRRLLHIIPQSGLFTVVFTLSKRAVSASHESNLPEEILSAIDNAREYAEGRSFRFDVTNKKDVAVVKKIVAIKISKC